MKLRIVENTKKKLFTIQEWVPGNPLLPDYRCYPWYWRDIENNSILFTLDEARGECARLTALSELPKEIIHNYP